jgi:26S proteasome regulatory subunit N4
MASASSSSSASSSTSSGGGSRALLAELIAQRELLEIEHEAIHSDLTSPGPNGEPPAGLKDSLIDQEGFPRGDVDIYEVKRKRQRLAVLNTDHKALMKRYQQSQLVQKLPRKGPHSRRPPRIDISCSIDKTSVLSLIERTLFFSKNRIEKLMEAVYTEATEASATSGSASSSSKQSSSTTVFRDPSTSLVPIAKLDEILEGSPAAEAGIRDGDLLYFFGPVSSAQESPMSQIPVVVRDNVGKPIKLIVQRKEETDRVEITITPKSWSGRGLLGCHLSPLV